VIPLETTWNLLVALWYARGMIVAVGLALWFWFWLCRRYPLVTVFVLKFLRGLFGRR
jgi:hypothetical protein